MCKCARTPRTGLIICNRAYGELVYPALGMPYKRGYPQRSEQGLVEDPKGRQEERVYRRFAGSAAPGPGFGYKSTAQNSGDAVYISESNEANSLADRNSRPSRKPRPESCKPKQYFGCSAMGLSRME
jgi:hypothetical protein